MYCVSIGINGHNTCWVEGEVKLYNEVKKQLYKYKMHPIFWELFLIMHRQIKQNIKS